MSAAVCALFIKRRAHAGFRPVTAREAEIWRSRELELPLALEMAIGMRDAGIKRVWLEATAAPAHKCRRL